MSNGNASGGHSGGLPKVNLFKDTPTEAHVVPNQAPPVPPPVLTPPPSTPGPAGAGAGQPASGSGRRVSLIAIGVVVALVAVIALFAVVSGSDKQDQESADPAAGGVEASPEEQATTAASAGTNGSTPITTATAPPSRQAPTSASASCVAPEGFEADQSTVRYEAGNVLDGLPDTAWRCPGSAVGQTLRVTLAGPMEVTSIGLLPGYAKIDPTDGTNRFFQNRRVTAVRYHFDDESTVDQSFADTPTTQTVSISAVTSSIVIEILSTTGDGGRDFTAISEIEIIGRPGTSCGSADEAPGGGCCVDYVDAVGFPDAPPPGLCASE